MVNLCAYGVTICLMQLALGSNTQKDRTHLKKITPKRDVFYVGGRYTNITASLSISTTGFSNRIEGPCYQFYITSYEGADICRKVIS